MRQFLFVVAVLSLVGASARAEGSCASVAGDLLASIHGNCLANVQNIVAAEPSSISMTANFFDGSGYVTPLNLALRDDRYEIAAFLLDHGAALDVPSNENCRVFEGGMECTLAHLYPLHYAARAGDLRAVRLLVDHGADIHQSAGYNTVGQEAICFADPQNYDVRDYLYQKGAVPRACSFLHLALTKGDLRGIDYSVHHGETLVNGDLDVVVKNVSQDRTDVLDYLLGQGLDPNSSNAKKDYWDDSSLLAAAIKAGKPAFLSYLIHHGASLQTGTQRFVLFSYDLNLKMYQLLLQLGADPSLVDNQGQSAIHHLPLTDSRAILALLDGTYHVSLEQADNAGRVPLVSLMSSGIYPVETLSYFLTKPLHWNVVDNDGTTLLDHAVSSGYSTIAVDLLAKGVDPNHEDRSGRTAPLYVTPDYPNAMDLLNLLGQHGANLRHASRKGETLITKSLDYPPIKIELLEYALKKGVSPNIGLNDMAQYPPITPLGMMALIDSPSNDDPNINKAWQLLFVYGANPNYAPPGGHCALYWVGPDTSEKGEQMLKSHGAKPCK